MCGICGKLTWNQAPAVSSSLLERMNQTLTHRGPDDDGFFLESLSSSSTKGSGGLAMRRLSIIDLETGKQPVENEDKSVIAVYNGEIYNFQELRSDLTTRGHQFRTQTDSEVLTHGYEEWDLDLPTHLNGMFGFALWDKKNQRFLLVRDRMGIKPLYYALSKKSIGFWV